MIVDRYDAVNVFELVPKLCLEMEPELAELDRLLSDDALVGAVRADLSRRHPNSGTRGRRSTPVEVTLRMLVLRRLYGWSYEQTEHNVSDSLVQRQFTRLYLEPVPDDTALIRWAGLIEAQTLERFNERTVELARSLRVTRGRKLRTDRTVVEANIHHPTDSSLLVDGIRLLSRVIRHSKPVVEGRLVGVPDAFRSRILTMRRGLQALHRLRRRVGADKAERRQAVYETLLATTEATVRQMERIHDALRQV